MTIQEPIHFLDRPIAITDLETTGLDPTIHEIIDVGLIVIHPQTFEILFTLDKKVKPRHIEMATPKALEVNGYNETEWVHAPDLKSVMETYATFAKNAVFCSHNITFDWAFMEVAFKKTEVLNTMDYHRLDLFTMACVLLRKRGLTKFRLKNICEFLDIPPEPDMHRAFNGTFSAYEVYKKLAEL